jgi:hypothetical protein
MVAAAVIAGAAISAVASNSAAKKGEKSANRAADLSNNQYNQTRKDQLSQYEQQRADRMPYQESGYKALSQLDGGLAPGGEFNRNFTMADYQQDPGMQFRVDQGEQAINRAATAGGSRYSGATLKALARFNSGLASQEYGNAYNRFKSDTGDRFNRLSGMAGTGQAAVNQTGQAGQNAYSNIAQAGQINANTMGQAAQNAGAARASGYVGVGNAVNGGMGMLVNNYQQQQYLSQMNGGMSYTPPPDYGQGRDLGGYDAQANGGWGIE